jgi:hypothetical protein
MHIQLRNREATVVLAYRTAGDAKGRDALMSVPRLTHTGAGPPRRNVGRIAPPP